MHEYWMKIVWVSKKPSVQMEVQSEVSSCARVQRPRYFGQQLLRPEMEW